ncbi:MAG: endonuclease/exonuclease/phosphatase family protein [Proteobacteria bacterium]|nr:endonuclease/exonuclease/phosphatase family protein [Pseudomonadota bacterium]
MRFRLVTWNVNSIRLRLAGLKRLVRAWRPDLVCLQETKVADERFPYAECRALGFAHVHAHGMGGYNGVAILSRLPLAEVAAREWCGRADRRHLFATIRPAGRRVAMEIHNLYVPAGGDVPDPALNDKFAHKLAFLDEVTAWLAGRGRRGLRAVLAGDLNVAPLPTDVWSHRQLLAVVSHTPVEVARLERLAASLGWADAVRRFIPPAERLYTWWSYRARDWSASDRGRRLDHLWVTPALAPALAGAAVLRAARGWEDPSDHVPVRIDLAL